MKTIDFLNKVKGEGKVHFERTFLNEIKSLLGLPFIEKIFVYDNKGLKKVYIIKNIKDDVIILNDVEGILANLYTIKNYYELIKFLMDNVEIIAEYESIFLVYVSELKDKRYIRVEKFFNKILDIEIF